MAHPTWLDKKSTGKTGLNSDITSLSSTVRLANSIWLFQKKQNHIRKKGEYVKKQTIWKRREEKRSLVFHLHL